MATFSWVLVAWKDSFKVDGQYQIMLWLDQSVGGSLDLGPRIFFTAYAVITCGLAIWGGSYIDENSFYLYREEAGVLYAICLGLVAITAVYAGSISEFFFLAPHLGQVVPEVLGVFFAIFYLFRLATLHELPSRADANRGLEEHLSLKFKAGLILLSVAIWIAVFEAGDLVSAKWMGYWLPVMLGGLSAGIFFFVMGKIMAQRPDFWIGQQSGWKPQNKPQNNTPPAIIRTHRVRSEFTRESASAGKNGDGVFSNNGHRQP